jgi:hypothetical protein
MNKYCLVFSFPWLLGQLNAQNSVIDSKTGIQFIFRIEANMFPSNWYEAEIQGKALPIDKAEISRSIQVFRKCVAKYPAEILKKHLKKVYVVKSLTFYGNVGFGGTYSSDKAALYISNNGVAQGYTNDYLEQTFHHEFSSILLEKHPHLFNKADWQAINGQEFSYGSGGVSAIQNNESSTSFDEQANQNGFLSQYSQSDIEEDFNIFAENLFKARPKFWEIVAQYPQLTQKLKLLIAFYHRISPSFHLDYFKKISKK